MDFRWLTGLNDAAARHRWLEQLFHLVAVDGVLVFAVALVVLSMGTGRFASVRGRRASATAAASAGLALLVAQVIGHLWDRARPYEAHAGAVKLFLSPSPDPSFPSDHATGAFAIAVAVLLYHRRVGALLVALAVAVCVSRVGLGTHYPSDVTAGAALGALTALLLHTAWIRARIERLADLVGARYDAVLSRRSRPPVAA
jgi:undecaprenyl-diphosphatase